MVDPLPTPAEIEAIALAGYTVAEIAAITGLPLNDVSDILDALLRSANAERAVMDGDEVELARLLRLANGAIPEICEPIFTMLHLGMPDKPDPVAFVPGWINPGRHVESKWRLIAEPNRRVGRPYRNSPHRSPVAVQADCLDHFYRDPIAALRSMAELLDPPAGAEWRLVFKSRTGRRGLPSTELNGQLRAAWTQVEMDGAADASNLKDEIHAAGVTRRTIFRHREILIKLKRERDRLRQEAKRRASGAKPHAQSASRTKSWKAAGFKCRRTWERHMKKAAVANERLKSMLPELEQQFMEMEHILQTAIGDASVIRSACIPDPHTTAAGDEIATPPLNTPLLSAARRAKIIS